MRLNPKEISAFDKNFNAIINEQKPITTFTLLSRLLDLATILTMAGNIKGKDKPIAKPNIPIVGPIKLTLNVRSSTSIMMGKVEEEEVPGRVRAMNIMPLKLFVSAFFASELIQDSGSFVANPPRNVMPRTINVLHK